MARIDTFYEWFLVFRKCASKQHYRISKAPKAVFYKIHAWTLEIDFFYFDEMKQFLVYTKFIRCDTQLSFFILTKILVSMNFNTMRISKIIVNGLQIEQNLVEDVN